MNGVKVACFIEQMKRLVRSRDEVMRERLVNVLVDGVAALRVDKPALVAHEVRCETCAVDRQDN